MKFSSMVEVKDIERIFKGVQETPAGARQHSE